VKTPWSIRLFEKIGISDRTCPRCKRESLELVWVNFDLSMNARIRVQRNREISSGQDASVVVYNDS
ncbi:MAG: hypothetical protein ABIT06_10225, partial [Saprospiraceae bacterium]